MGELEERELEREEPQMENHKRNCKNPKRVNLK